MEVMESMRLAFPAGLRLSLYATGEHPELAVRFLRGQAKSLDGATAGTPATYMLAVEEGAEIRAGIGVHCRTPRAPLPMESFLGDRSPWLRNQLREMDAVAEISGLWADESLAGMGLGFPLLLHALGVCRFLGVEKVVALSSPRTYAGFIALGFNTVSLSGSYASPDERYDATVMVRSFASPGAHGTDPIVAEFARRLSESARRKGPPGPRFGPLSSKRERVPDERTAGLQRSRLAMA